METVTVRTRQSNELADVTEAVRRAVVSAGLKDGLVTVFVPHTTAAVTINENADPDVVHDILFTLEELVPRGRGGYRHSEGNSDAHVKASLVGPSVTLIVENGQLVLGTWQGVYLCEFDGPRTRRVLIKVTAA